VKMFDADKNRMIGLPYGEKTITKTFSSDTGTFIWTDGQTDRCYINIATQYADGR